VQQVIDQHGVRVQKSRSVRVTRAG